MNNYSLFALIFTSATDRTDLTDSYMKTRAHFPQDLNRPHLFLSANERECPRII
jgi:hypothetical protein